MARAEESPIYRDLMRFKPDGLTPNAWAVKAGVSRTVWADMRRHGNPSRRTLERLLAAAGSSLAEFEALRVGTESSPSTHPGAVGEMSRRDWTPTPLPPLPLFTSSLAGEWLGTANGVELMGIRRDEILDRLPRPASLAVDRDAFAVTVVGDSMWPRFRPGCRIAVSPRSPVAIGDDVLVILRREAGAQGAGDLVLLKELVRSSGGQVELRQFNPDIAFKVDASDVEAIYKVAGELF